jgi:hypothetical protein
MSVGGGTLALTMAFQNRSPGTLEVDWVRSVLLAPNGRSLRLLRRGVRLADRANPGPPTTIPAGANFEDLLYPAEGISYSSGRYGGWNAEPFFERLAPGNGFGLLLTLRSGNELIERHFRFRASMEPTS